MPAVKTIAALLAATALCAPAWADEAKTEKPKLHAANVPSSTVEDPNVRTVPYNPHARYRIIGNIGRTTILTFGTNESVWRVSFGDAETDGESIWVTDADGDGKGGDGPAIGNNLNMWPKRTGRTNLTIITKVEGASDRTYHFDAAVRGVPECKDGAKDCDDPEATYGLIFTYPEQARQQRLKQAEEQRQEIQTQREARLQQAMHRTAKARLAVDHYGGRDRNWCWEGQGDAAIGPNKNTVSNNTQETVMDFGGRPIPAFSLVTRDGADGDVLMPTVRDGLVVLQTVAERIRMRIGDKMVLDLINCGSVKEPTRSPTGTISPDVYRVVNGAR